MSMIHLGFGYAGDPELVANLHSSLVMGIEMRYSLINIVPAQVKTNRVEKVWRRLAYGRIEINVSTRRTARKNKVAIGEKKRGRKGPMEPGVENTRRQRKLRDGQRLPLST